MSTSPPHLSPLKLLPSPAITSNPSLSAQITHLVNRAFSRSKEPSPGTPSKWDNSRPRFTSPEDLHAMLSDERSVMALIFDASASSSSSSSPSSSSSSTTTSSTESGEEEQEREGQGLLVACAAAIPWSGGWHKEGASTERGWEIKIVCVHDDAKYRRKGLAVRLLRGLEEYLLVRQEEEGKVTLWILAAECINGGYWRRRGYEEVRRRREGGGVWGCRGEFDMVVFKKEVGS